MEAETGRTGEAFVSQGERRDGILSRVVGQAVRTAFATAGVADQLAHELRTGFEAQQNELGTRGAALETALQAAIGGMEGRLCEALGAEIYRSAAHLDGHLTEHVSLLVEGSLAGPLRALVTEIADQAATEREARSQHLIDHINARTADLQASSQQDMRAALDAGLERHANLLRQEMLHAMAAERTALAQEVHRQMHHVDSHLSAHLTKELALQLGAPQRGAGSGAGSVAVQQRLLTLGRLLSPATASGVAKCRVGRWGDGGYVMLDDLDRAPFALSLGVGDEMTWDLEMARRGVEVHQFDYTIEAPPETHERIVFHRSRIAPVAQGTDHSFASAQALGGHRPCIIKMDIEGDEWAVLDAAADDDFSRATQLVIELHDFDRVEDNAWAERAERVLRRLQKDFQVVHVHANNNGLYRNISNVAFPEILEVTFASRHFYDFEASAEIFPTALDAPNREDLPEIILGAFRF